MLGYSLALLLSVAVAACAWWEAPALPQTSQHRDADTQLLNRAGLDVVIGPFLSQQAIAVVMLCEFKPQASAGMSAAPATPVALSAFARLLKTHVRHKGWVARVGEEEFVLALREMDLKQAQAMVARMQTAITRSLVLQGHVASFGAAAVHAMDTMDLALHRADVALYQVKEESLRQPLVAKAL